MTYKSPYDYFINQREIEKKLDNYLKENNKEIDGFIIDSYESLSAYIYSKVNEQIAKDFTNTLKLADVGDINKFTVGDKNNMVFDINNTMTNYFSIDKGKINHK